MPVMVKLRHVSDQPPRLKEITGSKSLFCFYISFSRRTGYRITIKYIQTAEKYKRRLVKEVGQWSPLRTICHRHLFCINLKAA